MNSEIMFLLLKNNGMRLIYVGDTKSVVTLKSVASVQLLPIPKHSSWNNDRLFEAQSERFRWSYGVDYFTKKYLLIEFWMEENFLRPAPKIHVFLRFSAILSKWRIKPILFYEPYSRFFQKRSKMFVL